ncbi:MAG: carboxymuconolactone decarboxylase family protein [candidate division Zixibacteria bacterium]|nr:carboxymuconolactone decarboxylase family protein [candidate division Zixibacteria bacterium]
MDLERFLSSLTAFKPHENVSARILALYSAAIAMASDKALSSVISLGQSYSVQRDQFYEIMLQSYLFLGFPRMLIAAENLAGFYPNEQIQTRLCQVDSNESTAWFKNGISLCKRVYGSNFEPLKTRVESLAPEVFRWMIIEGYGKVLSRSGLDIVDRELAIVASLMVENREKQLFSHMKGALNVGTDETLLKIIVDDLGAAAGDGYQTALAILTKLENGS